MLDFLNTLFQSLAPLWEMSVTAAYAAAVVIILRLLLKKRAPRQVLCLLWLVVFARLLIPVSLKSPLSIVPDALPGQEQQILLPNQPSGAGQPVTPNQPANGTVTPVASNPAAPSLTIPEGVAPAAPQPEAPAPFPWQAVLAGVWLAGMAALTLYALFSYVRLRRCLFDAIRAEDGAWEHPAVNSPFILGFIRPQIYLPAGLAGQPRQFILCHERAHLRRLDHIVKPVCWVALALHWFNPVVWAAYILMSRDIETACDEAVIRRLGPRVKADYSATLLALATNRRVPAPCPLAFDEGDAKGRIKNVLRYRRPALWIVVVSVIAAVLAAVCLLTDPVAAKEPGADPSADPSPSAAPSPAPVDPADTLLDPWMREVLDGERSFSPGGDAEFNIHQLRTMVYGHEELPKLTLEVGRLAILDLDRDGINEMVVWPTGESVDSTEVGYYTGYFIFSRLGDMVYVDYPGWRVIGDLKADGTFDWSGSAFEWGTGSARFNNGRFEEVERITWQEGMETKKYFVNGLSATREEFEAAYAAQRAKPDPTWYVFENGQLKILSSASAINVPIPLDDDVTTGPVPDFLDADQQMLYRQALTMYRHIFGANTESVDDWPGGTGHQDSTMTPDGYTHATGLYSNWDDFEEAVLSVFTREFWDTRNDFRDGLPTYKNIDGQLHYIAAARGSYGYNATFPETFRLVERTEDTISFIMTGYYSEPWPMEGESYEERDARLESYWDYSIEYSMRMVRTEQGWRFDEFHSAHTDNGLLELFNQRVPNPNAPAAVTSSPEPSPDPTPSTSPVPDPEDTPSTVPASIHPGLIASWAAPFGHFAIVQEGYNYLISVNDRYHSVDPSITTDSLFLRPWIEDLDGDGSPEALFSGYQTFTVYDVVGGQLVSHAFDHSVLYTDLSRNTVAAYNANTGGLTVTYSWGALNESTRRYLTDNTVLPNSFFDGCEGLKEGTLTVTAQPTIKGGNGPNGGFWYRASLYLTNGTQTSPAVGYVDFEVFYTNSGFNIVPGSCVLT